MLALTFMLSASPELKLQQQQQQQQQQLQPMALQQCMQAE